MQRVTFELRDGVAEIRQVCPERRNGREGIVSSAERRAPRFEGR